MLVLVFVFGSRCMRKSSTSMKRGWLNEYASSAGSSSCRTYINEKKDRVNVHSDDQ